MKLKLIRDISHEQNLKLAEIDAQANRELSRYRSQSDYSVAVYALKRAEIDALDTEKSTLSELTMLNAEALATGITSKQLVAIWREKMRLEDINVPLIEALRQVTRQSVKASKSLREIEEIVANVQWPRLN